MRVQYLCCDNASENVPFKKACKQEGMALELQFTTPSIPQQNGRVKQKFATLFNWVCAMLNGRKITCFMRNGFWAEAANTATLLKNRLVTPNRNISPFQQLLEKVREAPCLQCKKLVKCVLPPTGITHTELS